MTNWSKVRSIDIMHNVYFKKAFSLHLYVSKYTFKWKNHFQFLTIFLKTKTLINAVEDDVEGNLNV